VFPPYLELRTMADVGLIGFPNAGKSTFLRSISRARPKVAAYPFTTLQPHVGIVFYDDYETVSVADIPGIVEDAHKNKGLGIEFLRHIERCVCLIYVVDLSQPNPVQQFETLKNELEQYRTGLSGRPHAVIANKIDLEEARDNVVTFQEYAEENDDLEVFFVSGKTGTNLRGVLDFMKSMKELHCTTKEKEENEE
jgi:GTP-binding protein